MFMFSHLHHIFCPFVTAITIPRFSWKNMQLTSSVLILFPLIILGCWILSAVAVSADEMNNGNEDGYFDEDKRAANFAFAKRPSFAFAKRPQFAFAKRVPNSAFAFAKRGPSTFAFAKRNYNKFAFAKRPSFAFA